MDYLKKLENPRQLEPLERKTQLKVFTQFDSKKRNLLSPNLKLSNWPDKEVINLDHSTNSNDPSRRNKNFLDPINKRSRQARRKAAQTPDPNRQNLHHPEVGLVRDKKIILSDEDNQKSSNSERKSPELRVEAFLQCVHEGCYPDFGFANQLTFTEQKPGWHLFLEILGGYPKHQQLANYMGELRKSKQKKLEEKEKISLENHKMLRNTKDSKSLEPRASCSSSPSRLKESQNGLRKNVHYADQLPSYREKNSASVEPSPRGKIVPLSQQRFIELQKQNSKKFDRIFEDIQTMKNTIEEEKEIHRQITGRHCKTPSVQYTPQSELKIPQNLKEELKLYKMKVANFSPILPAVSQTDRQNSSPPSLRFLPQENQSNLSKKDYITVCQLDQEEDLKKNADRKEPSLFDQQTIDESLKVKSSKSSPFTLKKSAVITHASLNSKSISLRLRLRNIKERIRNSEDIADKERHNCSTRENGRGH